MTSKKIIALTLIACMLLSCMPVLAGTVYLDDVAITNEGLSVKPGRILWENCNPGVSATNALIGLDEHTDSKLFVNKTTTDYYKGVTLSFTATFYNDKVPSDVPKTFTVVDAVPNSTKSIGGGTEMCFVVSPLELINKSPELKALNKDTGNLLNYFGFTQMATPFGVSNLVVKKGTWEPKSVSTGDFPDGTIFLSYQEFQKYPSGYYHSNGYGYTDNFVFKNYRSVPGPYQFFVPETTGEYNVYVQLVSNNGSLAERAVELSINGKDMAFKPGDHDTSKLAASMVPVWCFETAAKTVTLTKDKVVAVQLTGNEYGRVTAIAFVPVASNSEISSVISNSPTLTQVSPEVISSIAAKAYHPDFASDSVSVTVEGTEFSVYAGQAAKRYDAGYYVNGDNTYYGLPVRVLPETNTFPTYVTALDVVAAYIARSGKDAPIKVTEIANGKIATAAVFVNEKLINDIDWYEIKEGDKIYFDSKDNKYAFDPVPVNGFTGVASSALIEAIGTPTSKTAVPGGNLKFCLPKQAAESSIGSFVVNLGEAGLKDCYLVGYATMAKTSTGTSTEFFNNLDKDGKVFFENVPFLDYNKNDDGSLNQGGGRIDLVTGGKVFYSATDPRYKNNNSEIVTKEDGSVLVKPYAYFPDKALYNWSNVYIVNASADLSLQAKKSDGKYTLTTGGMRVVDIVIATYSDDGKSIISSDVLKEQIVMFNAPLTITVGANQKAFVWNTNVYEGTTMVPAISPLCGSNFAN